MGIEIKSPHEIDAMRQTGRIVAAILEVLKKSIKPGIITKELDDLTVEELKRHGAKSSSKGYRGYPAHLCVSVNDELVHGIPGKRVLNEGDIVTVDFSAVYKGFHGDAARTVAVGKISDLARDLLVTTEEALKIGIERADGGSYLGDVSSAIQSFIESRGFSVVREYSGHGIGRRLHEDPNVPNFGMPGQGHVLRKGMTIALEPMVTVGDWHTKVGKDGWTVSTADGSLCAHFEDTIVITDGKAEILTVLE
jgi:methionyl aminopeptidase